jgi:imidazolonepropionase-like amidohydrolase
MMWRRLALLLLPFIGCSADAGELPVLFQNATIITMGEPAVLEKHDLLVAGGRIERIAPTGQMGWPNVATVVEAKGRFLMPGLAEMHAHVPGAEPAGLAEDVLLLYLAHGLTTVRGMLGQPAHLELRARLARGDLLGPRLFTSGPSVNGNSAKDTDTAIRMVREQKAAGYDFVKIHPGLRREVFDALASTAREAGIPFAGHISAEVGVIDTLAARQSAIDHLDGYVHALVLPDCVDDEIKANFFGINLTDCADPNRIPALVAATRAAGTWMAPTQVLIEQWAKPPSEAALQKRAAWRYVSPGTRAQWQQARTRFADTAPVADRFIELRRELIRQLHRAGVPILLASDAPQVFNIPGDSALAELELYGEIGLTPMEALATGTTNVARFFGQEDRFGQLKAGMDADLLLLSADPRKERAKLDEILDGIARRQAKR